MNILEKYPHIIKKIIAYWYAPNECREYLENLLVITDRISRDGFDSAVFEEIFFLLQIYNYVHPQIKNHWDVA